MAIELGKLGIWRYHGNVDAKFAAEAEKLGYGAIWLGGSPSGADLASVDDLLAATDSLVIATGIVNIWQDEPADIAKVYERIAAKYPDRFLLGVGAGHREATKEYKKPYAALVDYLDGLDAAGVPVSGRALAALGPKVVALSGERTAGAHPYLTTPEHTRGTREILGAGKLLAPEHKVVLSTDVAEARAIGRNTVKYYLGTVELRRQPAETRLHRRRPGRRGQRPAGRRAGVARRRVDDRAGAFGPPRGGGGPGGGPGAERGPVAGLPGAGFRAAVILVRPPARAAAGCTPSEPIRRAEKFLRGDRCAAAVHLVRCGRDLPCAKEE